MTDIWFGLAILLLLLALVFLLPAIRSTRTGRSDDSKRTAMIELYRARTSELQDALDRGAMDAKQVAQLETEMARELLAVRSGAPAAAPSRRGAGVLIGLALLVPIMAVGIYVWSERPGEVAFYREIVASYQGRADTASEARITSQLKAWVQKHPEDLRSRYVLAQRLLLAGDIAGAVSAYRFVVEREPQAASVKADLAQALFFAGGSRMSKEIRLLVKQVLESQPANGTALGLAGIAAYEDRDYRRAREYWQRALQQLERGSAAAEALAAGVARAEQALADNPKATMAPASSQAPGGPAIRVQVSLSGEIAADSATPVYIYARSADSPMPLAIVRLNAGQLPVEVVLDESRAMMPGRSIATVDSVQLVARLALNGDARPLAGDWQGTIESLSRENWGKTQSITIDRKL
ncbi:c-type cytochrome biogenesis protein CcmI [Microbulbifer spongiae]|uniref:C-type cytochrome biogenesis protein CcmI n=1 Tax=Microbulbifer spongiae TaxID=2944933 RepID=A0ABY9EF16_9GAMM|nr:c-type cytochrome biogenesis protein CcmI [Microbulbifer sp. MI-G]WKD50981.1 c-type cytochrome biogenesis protein CcmI [Microbulbifer sp. MI-G]